MNVLSLFDGISCARVALDCAKINVKTYSASEIDKHAIAISQKNYPDIVRLGDVREITNLPEPIDLLIGGSPCQDLSIAKKDRKGLAGDRSGLFWEYVRIWKLANPKWFVLENVASMPKADCETITQTLGVEPVLFNASLVSAQSRKRLFWTNIKFELPADRGILLKDILQPDAEVDPSMIVNGKSFCLTASYHKAGEGQKEYEHNKSKGQRTMVAIKKENPDFDQIGYFGDANASKVGGQALRVYDTNKKATTSGIGLYKVGHLGTTDAQANRVYDPAGKSATLSANGRGLGAKTGLYLTPRQQSNLRSGEDKAHCLTSTNYKGSQANGTTLVEQSARIRKLTPIECERLQGLPDNYTEGVAKTHRYKCVGNAFNVDVVSHILQGIQQE